MEYRTIYRVEEYQAIFDEDDKERTCAIDTRCTIMDFKELGEAKDYAQERSKTKDVDYPVRLVRRDEQRRERPEPGYSWRKGMGWEIVDDDGGYGELLQEYWHGELVN